MSVEDKILNKFLHWDVSEFDMLLDWIIKCSSWSSICLMIAFEVGLIVSTFLTTQQGSILSRLQTATTTTLAMATAQTGAYFNIALTYVGIPYFLFDKSLYSKFISIVEWFYRFLGITFLIEYYVRSMLCRWVISQISWKNDSEVFKLVQNYSDLSGDLFSKKVSLEMHTS